MSAWHQECGGLPLACELIYEDQYAAYIIPALTVAGVDLETRNEVAIKLEDARIDPSILVDEVEIYKSLSMSTGVPRVYWHGTECDFNAAVIDLLGPSLEDLLNYCDRMFSVKTTLMLADQLISRLQLLRNKKIVHRDVKSENFLMGRGRSGNVVFVTDFGLAKNIGSQTISSNLNGTLRYASVNGHLGISEQGVVFERLR